MNVNAKNNPSSILVLGAGELGMAMLRSLVTTPGASVAVLLRRSAIHTQDPQNRQFPAITRTRRHAGRRRSGGR